MQGSNRFGIYKSVRLFFFTSSMFGCNLGSKGPIASYPAALNAPSLAFFAAEGYALWGTLPNVVQMSEAESDVIIMGRTV